MVSVGAISHCCVINSVYCVWGIVLECSLMTTLLVTDGDCPSLSISSSALSSESLTSASMEALKFNCPAGLVDTCFLIGVLTSTVGLILAWGGRTCCHCI